jgi:hypothetical protein
MKYLPGISIKKFVGLTSDFARFRRLYLNRGSGEEGIVFRQNG